ncbi:MAG: cation:proton antiporter, partial [Gammaproteobacteria bacterium]|nr:cation:proton antiporter [Gammaproteobacteria bacterium]
MERYLAAVLVLGVSAQWLAWRLRLPSILLLLTFGALLGEYLAWEHGTREPVPTELLFPLVALSVGVILFEGGLSLQIRELRESGAAVIGLVTVGAAVTWTLSTVCLIWLIGIDPRVAAVIGGILVVTGPTVVAPLLRLIRPSRRVASMVKWEGIVIDPIGAV